MTNGVLHYSTLISHSHCFLAIVYGAIIVGFFVSQCSGVRSWELFVVAPALYVKPHIWFLRGMTLAVFEFCFLMFLIDTLKITCGGFLYSQFHFFFWGQCIAPFLAGNVVRASGIKMVSWQSEQYTPSTACCFQIRHGISVVFLLYWLVRKDSGTYGWQYTTIYFLFFFIF